MPAQDAQGKQHLGLDPGHGLGGEGLAAGGRSHDHGVASWERRTPCKDRVLGTGDPTSGLIRCPCNHPTNPQAIADAAASI